MDISNTEETVYYPPAYFAPDLNEVPYENVTMVGEKWLPGFVKVHRWPLFLRIWP